ncbi:YheC/YheD family protein [Paenibacillus filicis]|uniref:YheC/YheD family protein n=1 Tax=Paenibacillus gyeongsangnamensis TaxID=3388067 RepID=A0ABT4Q7A7_9BACL|nr:YheC/YheD family protein [Paenibacillus filicis]MCZ8512716.1 YheC/YheD family protein [Paenibacillus filicis]
MIRYYNNKLGKTKLLNRKEELRALVPTTTRATRESLHSMLKEYGMVYVKPNHGTGGYGVIKAERKERGDAHYYQYKHSMKERRFDTYKAFYHSIRKITGKKTYVVQKGIRLLRCQKRPFDIRVMVQLNERRRWEHTGTIGRMAHPRRIVTNYHNGGTPLPLGKLLKPHLDPNGIAKMEKDLADLGVKVAKHLQSGFPWVKEIGVDVGLDKAHRPWIFEVNTRPDPFIFHKLGKPSVFRKIMRLSRLHGRFRKK